MKRKVAVALCLVATLSFSSCKVLLNFASHGDKDVKSYAQLRKDDKVDYKIAVAWLTLIAGTIIAGLILQGKTDNVGNINK